MNTEFSSQTRAKHFGPSDCCIYCGDKTKNQRSTEHIIPKSLGGSLHFKEASCSSCQAITRKLEGRVIGKFLKPYNTIFNIPRPRKEALHNNFPIDLLVEGEVVSKQLPLFAHPPVIVLPVFGLPGVLRGKEPGEMIQPKLMVYGNPRQYASWVDGMTLNKWIHTPERRGNIDVSFKYKRCHVGHFMRFLAKIAHGFMMATLGTEFIMPTLPNYILGDSPTSPPFEPGLGSYLVGCLDKAPFNDIDLSKRTYWLASGIDTTVRPHMVFVVINLYPWLSAPWYWVGVGYPTLQYYLRSDCPVPLESYTEDCNWRV